MENNSLKKVPFIYSKENNKELAKIDGFQKIYFLVV